MRPYSSLASSFGSSACGPIGLSCGAGDYSAASIAALSCSLGASAGSGVLSAGSMGLLARACSRGGVWLNGGRRVAVALSVAAGAQMVAAPAGAACGPSPTYNDETLNGTTMTMNVDPGEEACDTTINAGGKQQVRGTANDTEINNGGEQIVDNGGVANNTKINNGGVQYVLNDGTANDTTINYGGRQSVNNGTANNTVLESATTPGGSGGYQVVSGGGFASGTEIHSGALQAIGNGGLASATTISSGGSQHVSNGGKATNTIINSNGKQVIYNGGVASGSEAPSGLYDLHCNNGEIACIRGGGSQVVSQGGKAKNVYVLGGAQSVESGGEAINTSMYGGGEQTVSGKALGGAIGSAGSQYVMDGGVASGVQVLNQGTQEVLNGGVASATTVKEDGTQVVSPGGTAQNTMLEGGTMHISTGGILLDKLSGYGTVKNDDRRLIMSGGGLVELTASGGSAGAEKTLVISKRIEATSDGTIRAFAHTTLRMADGETIEGRNGGAGTLRLEGGTIEAGRIEAGALSANDNSANTLRASGVNAGGNDGVIISGGYVSAGHVTVEGAYFAVSGGASTATVNIAKGKVTGDFRVDSGSGNLGTTEIEGDAELDSATLTGGVYKKGMNLDASSEIRNAAVSGNVTGDGNVTATRGGTMTVGGTISDAATVTVQENGNMAVGKLTSGTDMANFTVNSGGVLALGATGQTQADFTRLRSHASGGGVVALQGLNAPDATIAPAGAANTLVVDAKSTVGSINNFDSYSFAANALSTSGSALTVKNLVGGMLDIDASKVKLDTTNGGLSLRFGESAGLMTVQNGILFLNGTGAVQSSRLDSDPNGLIESAYNLTANGTTLFATYDALYLYGTGGTNTKGQRPTGNTLDFHSGIATAAFGGRSNVQGATVSGNTANMSGGELVQANSGDWMLSGTLYGGFADKGSASNNTANVTGGTYDNFMAIAGGGAGSGNATQNTVKLSGATFKNNIVYVIGGGATGDASGNTVTIESGDFNSYAVVVGGDANGGNATGNSVILNGGTFTDTSVYGGWVSGGNGNATNNTVALGANFKGASGVQLYGGDGGSDFTTGNTLSVEGKGLTVGSINNFENLHFILPANTAANETMLTVDGGQPTQFNSKPNVGVAIPAGVTLALQKGDYVTLLKNDSGLLNSSGTEMGDGDYTQVTIARQGISVNYPVNLSANGKTIVAEVLQSPPTPPQPTPPQPTPPQPTPPQPTPPQPTPPQPTPPGPHINPQTKSIPEGRAATIGIIAFGGNLVANVIGNLPQTTGGGAPNFGGSAGGSVGGSAGGNGADGTNGAGTGGADTGGSDTSGTGKENAVPSDATIFAQVTGLRQKIETGSHVNVSGAAAIVGAAKMIPLAGGGAAAVGAFFEYGDGTFKTYNDFDTGSINGKGDSSYYGAGVLARANFAGKGNGAPFVEGSLHAGSIRNNWHTDDLRDAATGARAQYDIRTPYMGGHLGAGYRWQTGATSSVEAYGQYLYTHMNGKDTNVALDPYHFSAVKSSRARLGAKADWKVNNTTSAYAGAAWEREFDGTARATAYTFDVPTPTMKGNSAVIDAGLSFQPKRNLTTNVGVTGYAGKRQGAAANVEVQYLF